MKRFVITTVLIATTVLTGCASTSDNLQRETARFVGDLTSSQVTVSNVQRGATNVSWKASTPKGQYECEADDMVRRVNCVKQ